MYRVPYPFDPPNFKAIRAPLAADRVVDHPTALARSRGFCQQHETNSIPAILIRGGRGHSPQRYRPDALSIQLETGMQVVTHENRTATGQRQLVAWCSGNGVTLNHDGAAGYMIAKLGHRCIDPRFPRERKRFGFTLFWLEKFSRV